MRQAREGHMSLVPPWKAILDVLCVSGKISIEFITELRWNWGKLWQIVENVIGRHLRLLMEYEVINKPQRNTIHILSPQNPQQCHCHCCQYCSMQGHMSNCTPCGWCCGQCWPTNLPNIALWSIWACVKGEELLGMRIIKTWIWLVPTHCDAISFWLIHLVVIPICYAWDRCKVQLGAFKCKDGSSVSCLATVFGDSGLG